MTTLLDFINHAAMLRQSRRAQALATHARAI